MSHDNDPVALQLFRPYVQRLRAATEFLENNKQPIPQHSLDNLLSLFKAPSRDLVEEAVKRSLLQNLASNIPQHTEDNLKESREGILNEGRKSQDARPRIAHHVLSLQRTNMTELEEEAVTEENKKDNQAMEKSAFELGEVDTAAAPIPSVSVMVKRSSDMQPDIAPRQTGSFGVTYPKVQNWLDIIGNIQNLMARANVSSNMKPPDYRILRYTCVSHCIDPSNKITHQQI